MTTFDEQFNNDLPGEIHDWTEDPADQQFHDERTGTVDDDWYDADALTSCGWGEDEAYGYFGEDC